MANIAVWPKRMKNVDVLNTIDYLIRKVMNRTTVTVKNGTHVISQCLP